MQVVDGNERQATRPGERLGRRETDEQSADQARALRDGDRLEVVEGRVAERLAHHREYELEVVARRNLRHDPAEARVQVCLRGDDAAPDLAAVDERRRGLVAARFYSEDQGFAAGSCTGSFHMISASSRLSV